jgi:hypothetical protein
LKRTQAGIMMLAMRTTLTLDDDVAQQLREIAHRRKIPLKEAVNATLRLGLARAELPRGERPPFRVETFASPFRPGVDPARLNQVLDELEARESFEGPVR